MKYFNLRVNVFLAVATGAFLLGKYYGATVAQTEAKQLLFTDRATLINVQLATLHMCNSGGLEDMRNSITRNVDFELSMLSGYADIPKDRRDTYIVNAISLAHEFRRRHPHVATQEQEAMIAKSSAIVDSRYRYPYD